MSQIVQTSTYTCKTNEYDDMIMMIEYDECKLQKYKKNTKINNIFIFLFCHVNT